MKTHALKDQGMLGQFYACHAERQQFIYIPEVNNIVVNTNSDEVRKAFVCETFLKCCNDCVRFFRLAAKHYKDKVDVVINRARYGQR